MKKNKTSLIKCSGPGSISLGSFYKDYKKGLLVLPHHQSYRAEGGGCWDETRIKKWINLIINIANDKSLATGERHLGQSVVTYRLADQTDGPKYINDGAHRTIHSIENYLNSIEPDFNSKDFDKQKEYLNFFLQSLDSVYITEQYRIYKSNEVAVDDFVNLNTAGVIAPAYEVLSALFSSGIKKEKQKIFQSFLNDLEMSIPNKLINLGHSADNVGKVKNQDKLNVRKRKQKYIRDTRASFMCFVSEHKLLSTYRGVSQIYLNNSLKSENRKHEKIEPDLIQFINQKTAKEINESLKKFNLFLDKVIGLFKQVWEEAKLGKTLSNETAVRWWIFACIYWKNNSIPIDHRKFLEKWFKDHRGSTTLHFSITDENGNVKPDKTTTQLQLFKSTIYIALGLDIEKYKRKKNRPKLQVGYHHSHVKSLSKNGEGETIPENSFENLKRGAKDMTEEEVDRIKTVNF